MMEMVTLSSSELEILEPVEIKLLSRKPQTIWAIRTVEPIMQKLLLPCPGLSSAPTSTQHCSQGPCWFSVLFKILPTFPPFLLSHIWTFTTFKACQADEDAEPWAPVLATCPAPSSGHCLSSLNNPDGERDHQIKKTNQNNTSIISTTEKPDDLCRHIWADFSHARVEQ